MPKRKKWEGLPLYACASGNQNSSSWSSAPGFNQSSGFGTAGPSHPESNYVFSPGGKGFPSSVGFPPSTGFSSGKGFRKFKSRKKKKKPLLPSRIRNANLSKSEIKAKKKEAARQRAVCKARKKERAERKEAMFNTVPKPKGTPDVNPIKIIQTPYQRKLQMRKNKYGRMPEIRKFAPNTIKQKYAKLARNPALDTRGVVLVGFLKYVLYQIYPKDRIHANIVSGYALNHRNALKLFRFEVRKLLDERFGSDNGLPVIQTNKRIFLENEKRDVLTDDEHFFQDGQQYARGLLIDECIDELTSVVFPSHLVPIPEDYVKDPSIRYTYGEQVKQFKFMFLTDMYQALGFVLESDDSMEDTLRFHLGNAIIPLLLVEYVRSYETYVFMTSYCQFKVKPGDGVRLPSTLKCLNRKAGEGYIRNADMWKMYAKLVETGREQRTDLLDVIPADTTPSTRLVRDLANVVLFSDEMFSVVKYKLIDHTPYMNLTRADKLAIFDDLVKSIYRKAMELWDSDVTINSLVVQPLESLKEEKY